MENGFSILKPNEKVDKDVIAEAMKEASISMNEKMKELHLVPLKSRLTSIYPNVSVERQRDVAIINQLMDLPIAKYLKEYPKELAELGKIIVAEQEELDFINYENVGRRLNAIWRRNQSYEHIAHRGAEILALPLEKHYLDMKARNKEQRKISLYEHWQMNSAIPPMYLCISLWDYFLGFNRHGTTYKFKELYNDFICDRIHKGHLSLCEMMNYLDNMRTTKAKEVRTQMLLLPFTTMS